MPENDETPFSRVEQPKNSTQCKDFSLATRFVDSDAQTIMNFLARPDVDMLKADLVRDAVIRFIAQWDDREMIDRLLAWKNGNTKNF